MRTIEELKAQYANLVDEEAAVLRVLIERGPGLAMAISAAELADAATEADTRLLRDTINRLIIFRRIPICCRPGRGGGYFIPASELEIERMYLEFYRRGMTGLVKGTRARKATYIDAIAQMAFGFDEDERVLEMRRQAGDIETGPPAWAQVATRMLDRITQDPERYRTELDFIRERYGDIFLPRERVRKIREAASELVKLTEGIAA